MIPLGDVIPVRTRPYVSVASMIGIPIAGGSLLQVASNVVGLWIFGWTVEDRLGHGRFAAFGALCAAIAALAQSMAPFPFPMATAAANGAVAGVIGAYFVLYPQSKVAVLVPVGISTRVVELPAVVMLAAWFLTQTAGGLGSLAAMRASPVPGLIPSWAHIAGLAMGAAGVMIFRRPERQRVEWWNGPPGRSGRDRQDR